MDIRLPQENMKMECIHCRGKMERGFAPLSIHRRAVHLQLDAVPAWVCTQCGEPCFESEEVDKVQSFIRDLERVIPSLGASQAA